MLLYFVLFLTSVHITIPTVYDNSCIEYDFVNIYGDPNYFVMGFLKKCASLLLICIFV